MTRIAARAEDEQVEVTLAATASEPAPNEGDAVTRLGPGTAVQQYELIREIGGGGMGTVFLARDTRLGRRVAIKFLRTADADLAKRFILEARTTASCNHENIVVIYEVGEHHGVPFMALEYLQGQPLRKLIAEQRLPSARAVELMVPVVRALVCAHAQNIVHRDLKPDNIVVTDVGTIKVLDFGIAKVLQTSDPATMSGGKPAEGAASNRVGKEMTGLTNHGALLGTIPYMAPEQWNNSELDHRVDIWAAGIMLFYMLSGRHPLAPLKGLQLSITKDVSNPMPSLSQAAPDVPQALARVVDRCLRKRREERFPDAIALLRALEPFLPGRGPRELRIEDAPYAGLSSFQESDADRFFGRAREVTAVVNRLRDRPVMAVVGPSGAGKSSFVRAGVIPALKRSGQDWEAVVLRPGRDPMATLAAAIAPLVSAATTLEDELRQQRQLVERLRDEPGYAGTVLRSRARREGRHILLFVDQVEEMYTQVADARERMAFTACLAGIADDATVPTRVVVSLRSDFLDRLSEDERFMGEVTEGLFFLSPPQHDGLRAALEQPAEMAGYRFESPALVEQMIEHLQSVQGALPLLQFAASRLWEARDPARRLLTERSYNEMGGIAGALATHADSVLAGLTTAEQTLVRALLLRLVTVERTRAIVAVEELQELSPDPAEMQRLMHHLVQARLLVIQNGGPGEGATAEIVHESLIESWPTLRRWMEESQEDSAFLEQLRTAARQWQMKDADAGLLWRGDMVEEARRFKRRYRGELPQLQRDFLEAVLTGAAKAARLRRALSLGGAAVLLLIATTLAVAVVVIRREQRRAEEQAAVARAAEQEAKRNMREAQEQAVQRRIAQAQAEEAQRKAEEALAQAKHAQRLAAQSSALARQNQEDASNAKAELEQKRRAEQERSKQKGLIFQLKRPGEGR